MADTWYEDLGFSANPLDLRPNPTLVGLEQEEQQLVNHILKEEICFLNGMTGAGKTSLLMRVQQRLKDHTFIYLDAQDLPKSFNLEEEIKGQRNFFDRITFKDYPSKTPVLIIDEFQATDPNLVLEARGKWENAQNRRIKSIIIAQISKQLYNVTPAFRERLGSRIVSLRTLDDDEMKQILRLRLMHPAKQMSFYSKLSSDAVSLLIAAADGNPRRLLEYTDYIFDFHFHKFKQSNPMHVSDYTLTYWGAKEILDLHEINTAVYEPEHEKKRKRASESFEERYDKAQQNVLKYLMTGPKTLEEIQSWFGYSKSKAKQLVSFLREDGSIVPAGKKDKKKLFQIAPHVKRMTVHV